MMTTKWLRILMGVNLLLNVILIELDPQLKLFKPYLLIDVLKLAVLTRIVSMSHGMRVEMVNVT